VCHGLQVWHTVFQIEYHFVLVTKYRYKVLTGDAAERVRAMVRQVCETFETWMVSGVVSKDRIHILVSAPPKMAPSEISDGLKAIRQVGCLRNFRI
jgi:putative transposase